MVGPRAHSRRSEVTNTPLSGPQRSLCGRHQSHARLLGQNWITPRHQPGHRVACAFYDCLTDEPSVCRGQFNTEECINCVYGGRVVVVRQRGGGGVLERPYVGLWVLFVAEFGSLVKGVGLGWE